MSDAPAADTPPTQSPSTRAPNDAPPQLRRSTTDRVIAGVCGGIANYLGIDPVVVRVVAVALTLLDGIGIFLYVAAWLIMPERDPSDGGARTPRSGEIAPLVIGAVLVAAGGLLLIDRVTPGLLGTIGRVTWPLALIGIGVAILIHRR